MAVRSLADPHESEISVLISTSMQVQNLQKLLDILQSSS